MATQVEGVEAKQWELGAMSEVRFEVDFDACVTIVLVRGEAEVNGVELALGRRYRFGGCCFAVLSWRGAGLESQGRAKSAYVAERTTASAALNAHVFLEDRRERASRAATLRAVGGVYLEPGEELDEMQVEEEKADYLLEDEENTIKKLNLSEATSPLSKGCALLPRAPSLATPTVEFFSRSMNDDWNAPVSVRGKGPRVLIVGGADSGKSTLASTLAAYAARAGREPVLVDLDPSLGDLGVPPGGIGALRASKSSLSVEHGLSASVETAPFAFWFGHFEPSSNVDLYRHLVDRVATAVATRLSTDPRADAAGVIVNTCGWIDGLGLDLLKHTAASFAVDVVFVLSHDRLYQDIKAAVGPQTAVANLPRSGGLASRDSAYRRRARHKRVHEYFYGAGSHWQAATKFVSAGKSDNLAPLLAPSSLELRFRDIRLFKVIAPDTNAVDSMLPVGQGSMLEPLQVVNIPFTADLVHCLLAVCHPREDSSSEQQQLQQQLQTTTRTDNTSDINNNPYQFLLDCAAAGFVVVSNVDLARSTLTLLTPCSGDLPSNNLLLGDVEWIEGLMS